MSDFVKIPFYADETSGVNFEKVEEMFFNRHLITCFYGQLNELNNKRESIFYLVDGSEYYCPLTVGELRHLLDRVNKL